MDISRRHLLATSVLSGAAAALSARAWAQSGSPGAASPKAQIKVQIAIFDGFQITDALGPFDVLKLSELAATLPAVVGNVSTTFSTSLVTLQGEAEAVALGDVRVKPTAAWDDCADILVIPGAPSLWRKNIQPPGLDTRVRAWRESEKTLATVCTGGVLAARAGVLAGRNANTHRAGQHVLTELGVNLVADARVVDDGDVISSGGTTSGLDLALYLLERYSGALLALEVEKIFEYDRRGTVWRKG